jgi:hypothetical protein
MRVCGVLLEQEDETEQREGDRSGRYIVSSPRRFVFGMLWNCDLVAVRSEEEGSMSRNCYFLHLMLPPMQLVTGGVGCGEGFVYFKA